MSIEEILKRVEAEGIETIRVVFTDPHGILRGKTVTATALPGVLRDGLKVPSTLLLKDLSHRTAFPVWAGEGAPMQGASDVTLRPDPETFRVIPWSPHSAMVHCDVESPFCSRAILRRAEEHALGGQWEATMGVEIEFQVFRVLDAALAPGQSGMPGAPPQVGNTTQGYQYLTETRYAEVEPMLDRLRRGAEEFGIDIRSVEIEMGPSQYEVTFAPGRPSKVAEQAVNFRMLAKELSHRHGMLASFMPKPALPNAVANGWHIHQSYALEGRNFGVGVDAEYTPESNGVIESLLTHARATCLLTNPTVNSYKRFSAYQLAPNRIGWSGDNRGAMIRTITGPDGTLRLENRLPDSSANPYLALAGQLLAGWAPRHRRTQLRPPMANPYDDPGEALPASLGEAIEAFAASDMLRDALTPEVHEWLVTLKRHEWNRYLAHISDWEQAEYFSTL
ncbi:glutamine synthetase [Rhodobacterales bacterium HKCCE4037]|nr:glutamine synthetase [Rhodobacterales bacterium HKCCE4037]